MSNIRIGMGYDIHKFAKNKKLYLGGVFIPFKFGLVGHSDADALLHALCDAILGALGKPDIGQYFSDKDPKYKNMSSMYFLKKVKAIMKKERYKPVNIDCIIITDKPKIHDYSLMIKKNIARSLSIKQGDIAIKAKTTEGILSYSGKGIAVYCVVLLKRQGGRG